MSAPCMYVCTIYMYICMYNLCIISAEINLVKQGAATMEISFFTECFTEFKISSLLQENQEDISNKRFYYHKYLLSP